MNKWFSIAIILLRSYKYITFTAIKFRPFIDSWIFGTVTENIRKIFYMKRVFVLFDISEKCIYRANFEWTKY
jgi:hypothetical protein